MNDEPIEPDEIVGPNDQLPAKGGKGNGGKQPAKKPSRRFGRERTAEEIEEEERHARPFTRVALLGDWKRPGWQPSDEDRLMVQMLKFSGYTDEDVAAALGMSVETLLKWFDFELNNAKTLIVGDLATRAYVRARQGNDVLLMFLLKTRANGQFSEKTAQAQAITESLKDVEGLTDDKKASVIASLVDLLNPKKEKASAKKGETE